MAYGTTAVAATSFPHDAMSGAPPDYHEATASDLATAQDRMDKFVQVAAQHEISNQFASRLRQLEGYEIVFICDDSGSMATVVGK